ncbi:recombinase family protein [Lentzea sp. BCCO 10_0856]|uniref:Recombinase family protein n=1 Tax=Lentzea miocenica TaxID=3095431 RepID=A0ABU4T1Q2_9PSEU|nr:recombinase family protein [Lentzea sp. BCCO 10_0856]MDX8032090.1 recombinase family protein [Lentzea sp. BCCO 10_0856]
MTNSPPTPNPGRGAVGLWTYANVRDILTNPKYTGNMVWNRRARKSGGNARNPAGEMLWANFTDRPSLETFRTLRQATAEDFPSWRERVLAFLSDVPPATGSWSPGPSTLMEILLADDEIEAAWQAAVDGGCSAGCGSALRGPVPRATRPTPSRSHRAADRDRAPQP